MSSVKKNFDLIMIGSSTGGTVVIEELLSALPKTFSIPIVIAQHMPEKFIGDFVRHLNKSCALKVREAEEGDWVSSGTVLISSGFKTMTVHEKKKELFISYEACLDSSKFCPSINDSLKSLVSIDKCKVLGLMLSGIGDDGLQGFKELKKRGAEVWAQDKKDCIAFGMPKAVINAGVADKVVHASNFATELMRL